MKRILKPVGQCLTTIAITSAALEGYPVATAEANAPTIPEPPVAHPSSTPTIAPATPTPAAPVAAAPERATPERAASQRAAQQRTASRQTASQAATSQQAADVVKPTKASAETTRSSASENAPTAPPEANRQSETPVRPSPRPVVAATNIAGTSGTPGDSGTANAPVGESGAASTTATPASSPAASVSSARAIAPTSTQAENARTSRTAVQANRAAVREARPLAGDAVQAGGNENRAGATGERAVAESDPLPNPAPAEAMQPTVPNAGTTAVPASDTVSEPTMVAPGQTITFLNLGGLEMAKQGVVANRTGMTPPSTAADTPANANATGTRAGATTPANPAAIANRNPTNTPASATPTNAPTRTPRAASGLGAARTTASLEIPCLSFNAQPTGGVAGAVALGQGLPVARNTVSLPAPPLMALSTTPQAIATPQTPASRPGTPLQIATPGSSFEALLRSVISQPGVSRVLATPPTAHPQNTSERESPVSLQREVPLSTLSLSPLRSPSVSEQVAPTQTPISSGEITTLPSIDVALANLRSPRDLSRSSALQLGEEQGSGSGGSVFTDRTTERANHLAASLPGASANDPATHPSFTLPGVLETAFAELGDVAGQLPGVLGASHGTGNATPQTVQAKTGFAEIDLENSKAFQKLRLAEIGQQLPSLQAAVSLALKPAADSPTAQAKVASNELPKVAVAGTPRVNGAIPAAHGQVNATSTHSAPAVLTSANVCSPSTQAAAQAIATRFAPAQTFNWGGMTFPLSIQAPVTSGFGWRVHPISGDRRLHAGVDFGAPQGTPILAAVGGRVVAAEYMGGYGLTVIVENPQLRQRNLYAHMSAIAVQVGAEVPQGAVLGLVGSTGNSTGPHLHFEFQTQTAQGWVAIDPLAAAAQLAQQRTTAANVEGNNSIATGL